MDEVLITGAAGFIGFHLARRLLADGHAVVGVDDLNDYYDPQLKRDRLAELDHEPGFAFEKLDLADRDATAALFADGDFDRVVHLAAQAGVRYSLENPHAYIDSNLVGFTNVLEGCRHAGVEHLVFASSSSVYGANDEIPYSTSDNVDHPVSLYAATKKSNELLAHSYAHLYDLSVTGLRFFTVYGPWGRPDMAYFLFADAITKGEPIQVFGNGKMQRDFTYVGDVVEGVARVMRLPPTGTDAAQNGQATVDPSNSHAPYRLYNIGNGEPVGLMNFIETLEDALGQEAEKEFLPMQPGDVRTTYADTEALVCDTGYAPSTSLTEGIQQFVRWYRQRYEHAATSSVKAAA
jgi:UDP-glucuronate 4-epimerase